MMGKKLSVTGILLLLILAGGIVRAQNYGQPVKKLIKEADQYFENQYYDESLEKYVKADSLQPKDPYISYRIGFLHGYNNNYHEALPYLQLAHDKHFTADSLSFYLGRAYHISHRFDDAINAYQRFMAEVKLPPAKLAQVKRFIENCENGKILIKHPIEVKISNLGPNINTIYPEYLPLISANENMLLFTSRRESSTGGKLDPADQKYFEDIYISNKNNGIWSEPYSVGTSVNTDSHDAGVALSSDGQELIVYRGDVHGGDLFVSDLHGMEWSRPLTMGSNINTKNWEPGGCLSSNEKVLFFTSNKKGGYGGTDIYYTIKNDQGEFGPAKLLGPQVNTPFDENSPFIHADGKTLYFSSQGHNSIGGFDIFSVTVNLETGEVNSNPENIGYPINTAGNDDFFVWSTDNKRAYFSSNRKEGFGDKDIYVLERMTAETPVVLLEGEVRDCDSHAPLEAKIMVTDNITGKVVGVFHTNSTTGKYVIVLPANINYGIAVEVDAAHYMFYSKNIDNTQLQKYKEIMDKICLQKIKTGQSMMLKNVFFDVDKSHLREVSFVELRKLFSLLIENPSFKIKIIGHTDSDGSDVHNLKLSEDRALAISDYLKSKGIPAVRLLTEGKGESQPAANNDTDENKQLNRRIEVEFIDGGQ